VAHEIPADLQAALGERYQLRRVLGRGGMATVYLAYDGKHRREVALKVLLPGLAAFLGVERFLKEIQIAAGLTHPHILALHDSGEAGGFLYYEMLVGEIPGRWPTEEAVRTGRFLEATAPHRSRLADVGSRVEGALVRGLAIRHDQRTATPGALIDELTGTAAPRRRYSGGEIEEIVKRASEIEATAPTAGGAMTIGGVEALAAEVGIAPDVVRAAAKALERPVQSASRAVVPSKRNPWIDGPTSLSFERVVEGELPDSEWQVLVDEIRSVLKNPGQVSQFGRSFSWVAARSPGVRRDLEVAVSVRGGRTRITIQEGLSQLVGAVYGGIGGGMGGGGLGPILGILAGAMHLAGAAILVVIPLWLATTYATARAVYRHSTNTRAKELEGLADRLAELVRELVPPPARPALRNPERR